MSQYLNDMLKSKRNKKCPYKIKYQINEENVRYKLD